MSTAEEQTTEQRREKLQTVVKDFIDNSDVCQRIVGMGWKACLIGGVIRDLAISGMGAVPRDVDIVVDNVPTETVMGLFAEYPMRLNRFGGLKISTNPSLDIWAFKDTWAIREKHVAVNNTQVHFAHYLPRTTFLNIDAIVATLDDEPKIVDGGFFHALETKTIDINLEPNPAPVLNAVRAMVITDRTDLGLSTRMRRFIVYTRDRYTEASFLKVQEVHYGSLLLKPEKMFDIINRCRESI